MLNTSDPKYKPWSVVQEDLKLIAQDYLVRRNEFCLAHGFLHQETYSFKEPFRCVSYRSNQIREEFLVNICGATGNVFHLCLFDKLYDSDAAASKDTGTQSKNEKYSNNFKVYGAFLERMIWIPKHRFYVAFCSDRNLRVFSDTLHRCQPISSPTLCTMPVLSMVYLEETDEIVTGGIGVIQAWKIHLQETRFVSGTSKKISLRQGPKERSYKKSIFIGDPPRMLVGTTPYHCHLQQEDWVTSIKVFNRQDPFLIATTHDIVIGIDYIKRHQIWSICLYASRVKAILKPKKDSREILLPQDSYAHEHIHLVHGHLSFSRCDISFRFGYFITGGTEGCIKIMHLVNFGLIKVIRAHRSAVTGLIAHPTQNVLISSSSAGTIRIWCLETFKLTQRLDTGHNIAALYMCNDPSYIYYNSKQEVGLYRLAVMHSLYAILHSAAMKLTRIEGNEQLGFPGKILAALEDGSVAVIAPMTGLLLTMIYSMNTFQVFSEATFDPFDSFAYVRLQTGQVMQCDCSTNPSSPIRRYVPSVPYDQDVICLCAVSIRFRSHLISAILAGLRNGQITLVFPNVLSMKTKQAHTGDVKHLHTFPAACEDRENEFCWCDEKVVSVGVSIVWVWSVTLKETEISDMTYWQLALIPERKLSLPQSMLSPVLSSTLRDRLCLATEDHQIYIIAYNRQQHDVSKSETLFPSRSNIPDAVHSSMSFPTDAGIFSHNHDDDHTAPIIALDKSELLHCFASCSKDGYVKIWDEENRLIRELFFDSPNITALCFVNCRDLLVALEERLCLVECTTFVTSAFLKDHDFADAEVRDDTVERAIPYDDDIKVITDVEDIETAPLEVIERVGMPDMEFKSSVFARIKSRLSSDAQTLKTVSRFVPDGDVQSYEISKTDIQNVSLQPRESVKTFSDSENTLINLMTYLSQLKSKKGISEDIVTPAEAIHRWRRMLPVVPSEKSSIGFFPLDHLSQLGHEYDSSQKQLVLLDNKRREKLTLQESKIFRLLESNFPIAPDGYIPNSVIRKRFKFWQIPSSTSIAPTKPFSLASFRESLSESSRCLIYDWDSSEPTLGISLLSLVEDLAGKMSRRLTYSKADQAMANLTVDKIPELRKSLSASTPRYPDPYTLKTKPQVKLDDQSPLPSRDPTATKLAQQYIKPMETIPSDKEVTEEEQPGELAAPVLTEEVPTPVESPAHIDIQQKTKRKKRELKQKRDAELSRRDKAREPEIPSVLKDIVEASWFRRKLTDVNPDSVSEELLAMGDSVRDFTQQKVLESLSLLVREYGNQPSDSMYSLSAEMVERIQAYIAKYIRPSFDDDNPYRDLSNRSKLTHHALDALLVSVPTNDAIKHELLRLLIDDDHSIRDKARELLETKVGINTWDKLKEELLKVAADDNVAARRKESVPTRMTENVAAKRKESVPTRRKESVPTRMKESLPTRMKESVKDFSVTTASDNKIVSDDDLDNVRTRSKYDRKRKKAEDEFGQSVTEYATTASERSRQTSFNSFTTSHDSLKRPPTKQKISQKDENIAVYKALSKRKANVKKDLSEAKSLSRAVDQSRQMELPKTKQNEFPKAVLERRRMFRLIQIAESLSRSSMTGAIKSNTTVKAPRKIPGEFPSILSRKQRGLYDAGATSAAVAAEAREASRTKIRDDEAVEPGGLFVFSNYETGAREIGNITDSQSYPTKGLLSRNIKGQSKRDTGDQAYPSTDKSVPRDSSFHSISIIPPNNSVNEVSKVDQRKSRASKAKYKSFKEMSKIDPRKSKVSKTMLTLPKRIRLPKISDSQSQKTAMADGRAQKTFDGEPGRSDESRRTTLPEITDLPSHQATATTLPGADALSKDEVKKGLERLRPDDHMPKNAFFAQRRFHVDSGDALGSYFSVAGFDFSASRRLPAIAVTSHVINGSDTDFQHVQSLQERQHFGRLRRMKHAVSALYRSMQGSRSNEISLRASHGKRAEADRLLRQLAQRNKLKAVETTDTVVVDQISLPPINFPCEGADYMKDSGSIEQQASDIGLPSLAESEEEEAEKGIAKEAKHDVTEEGERRPSAVFSGKAFPSHEDDGSSSSVISSSSNDSGADRQIFESTFDSAVCVDDSVTTGGRREVFVNPTEKLKSKLKRRLVQTKHIQDDGDLASIVVMGRRQFESEPHLTKFERKIRLLDIPTFSDSGFIGSFATYEPVDPKAYEGWRQAINKLKKLRIKGFSSDLTFSGDDTVGEFEYYRMLNQFLHKPIRSAASCIDHRDLFHRMAQEGLLAEESFTAAKKRLLCYENESICKYGFLRSKWTRSQLKCFLSSWPDNEVPLPPLFTSKAEFSDGPNTILPEKQEFKEAQKLEKKRFRSSLTSKTNQNARKAVMDILSQFKQSKTKEEKLKSS